VVATFVLCIVSLGELEQLVEYFLQLSDRRVLGSRGSESTKATHSNRDLLDSTGWILEHLKELAYKELVRIAIVANVARFRHEFVGDLLQECIECLERAAMHVLVVVLAQLGKQAKHAFGILGQILLEQECMRSQEPQCRYNSKPIKPIAQLLTHGQIFDKVSVFRMHTNWHGIASELLWNRQTQPNRLVEILNVFVDRNKITAKVNEQ
jgi:hypothetical protein